MAVLWFLTRAAVKLSLLQDNNLSYSIPHRVKCRTEAVNSPFLETCKMLKFLFLSKLKFIKISIRISDTTPNSVSTSTWLCVTPNMKNSSHKIWQTSLLMLKPLQIQNPKRKTSPPPVKVGDTSLPNCTHANEDLWSYPRTALLRWRNNGGTWTLGNSFYILFPAKGIISYGHIIYIRLYVRLKGTCSLASRTLSNTGE